MLTYVLGFWATLAYAEGNGMGKSNLNFVKAHAGSFVTNSIGNGRHPSR